MSELASQTRARATTRAHHRSMTAISDLEYLDDREVGALYRIPWGPLLVCWTGLCVVFSAATLYLAAH